MEIIIYLFTASITIAWSVWVYIYWEEGALLPEDAGMRFFLIITPSSFFLLTVIIGMDRLQFFRPDIMGLLAIDVITIISSALLFILIKIGSTDKQKAYTTVVVLYNIGCALVVIGIFVLSKSETLRNKLQELTAELQKLDILSFNWAGLNTETEEQSLIDVLNKVLIALFSYIPITVIRFISLKRQKKKISKDIEDLRRTVFELQEKVENYSKIGKQ